jgi:hypothetical protein
LCSKKLVMVIERTSEEIILRLPSSMDTSILQKIIDYLQFKEIISKSEASEEQASELARESKENWWNENKHRFTK